MCLLVISCLLSADPVYSSGSGVLGGNKAHMHCLWPASWRACPARESAVILLLLLLMNAKGLRWERCDQQQRFAAPLRRRPATSSDAGVAAPSIPCSNAEPPLFVPRVLHPVRAAALRPRASWVARELAQLPRHPDHNHINARS